MKKTLLSIALFGSAFTASSQVLLSEDFNSYTANTNMTTGLYSAPYAIDAVGQGGWKAYAYDTHVSDTSYRIKAVGSGDNWLKITGTNKAYLSPDSSRTRYLYKEIDWTTRTAGNQVLFTSFIFGTNKANLSRNEISFVVFNDAFKTLLRYRYNKSTKTLTPGVGGINPANGAVGVATYTPVTLEDDKVYYCEMIYDGNTKKPYFFVVDVTGQTPVVKQNISGQAYTVQAQIDLYAKPSEFDIYVAAQFDGTANAVSSEFTVDDILVDARPCISYNTKANAAFSYTGSRCIGSANLAPVLVSPTSTGSFSTTPGLNLDATSGVINLGAGTVTGDYSIKFVTVDPYAPASGSTPAVPGACEDSSIVTITILNCAGIEEVSSANFTVYPNPANDVVTVSLADNTQNGSIVLTSADGKVIETRNFTNSSVESFDVKSLTSGVYFFQVGNTTQKVIIK